jgi:hypothetical protein
LGVDDDMMTWGKQIGAVPSLEGKSRGVCKGAKGYDYAMEEVDNFSLSIFTRNFIAKIITSIINLTSFEFFFDNNWLLCIRVNYQIMAFITRLILVMRGRL